MISAVVLLSSGMPLTMLVSESISRMPGPPRGPSWRTTITSPGVILPLITALVASSSLSKTRAGTAEGHLVLRRRRRP